MKTMSTKTRHSSEPKKPYHDQDGNELRWCTTHAKWELAAGGGYIYPAIPPKRGTNRRWACATCMEYRRKAKLMSNTLVERAGATQSG